MKPRSERRASTTTHRVLVVDDEPDIRELLELTLAKMGLQVDSAGSLGEARTRLRDARYFGLARVTFRDR